jgi:hypothetical protein
MAENLKTMLSEIKPKKAKQAPKKGGTATKRAVKSSKSTITPGGLLHRTIYFQPEEWEAVQTAASRSGRSAASLVREAVRDYLNMD